MARTSSLNCLSCRKLYQTPHSLNCLPPFQWKTIFFLKSASSYLPKNRLRLLFGGVVLVKSMFGDIFWCEFWAWVRLRPNLFVVVCVLLVCDVALVAYGGGGSRPTLPHSPKATLHAHHMPDLLSIVLQAFQHNPPTPTTFGDGVLCHRKGPALGLPFWKRLFVLVVLARKPIGRKVSRYGARRRACCGTSPAPTPILWVPPNTNNHFLMCVLRKHHGEQIMRT